MLAGHVDLDELDRWMRIGWERRRGADVPYGPTLTASKPVRLRGVTGDMWEDPVDVDGRIICDVGNDIAQKIGELPRTEAIHNQVQQAHLDRNVVWNAIDDKIKKSITTLDDTPQDHADGDA
jgi:hypothetical protein